MNTQKREYTSPSASILLFLHKRVKITAQEAFEVSVCIPKSRDPSSLLLIKYVTLLRSTINIFKVMFSLNFTNMGKIKNKLSLAKGCISYFNVSQSSTSC